MVQRQRWPCNGLLQPIGKGIDKMNTQIKNELEKNSNKVVTMCGDNWEITGTLIVPDRYDALDTRYKVVSKDGFAITRFNLSQVRFFENSNIPTFELW